MNKTYMCGIEPAVKSKICKTCNKEKLTSSFRNAVGYKDGLSPKCKDCEKIYNKQWNIDNSEKKKEYARTERSNHPVENWCRATTKNHAKKYDVRFTPSELYVYVKNINVCNICGKELDWSYNTKNGRVQHNSPTLDRIDNEPIMTLENIQILCHRCNSSKGDKTMKEFVKYCKQVGEKFDKCY